MAWGYRLEMLGTRDALRCRETGRTCAAGSCGSEPRFLSAYRYARANGHAITACRPLCTHHARLFSMKYSLAWPSWARLRRTRRPAPAIWIQELAAAA